MYPKMKPGGQGGCYSLLVFNSLQSSWEGLLFKLGWGWERAGRDMHFTGFYWFTARGIREGEELLVEKTKTKMQTSHFTSSILSFYPVAGHVTVNTSGNEISPILGSQASLWVCAVKVLYLGVTNSKAWQEGGVLEVLVHVLCLSNKSQLLKFLEWRRTIMHARGYLTQLGMSQNETQFDVLLFN